MLERPFQKMYSCMQNDLLEVSPQARKQDEMQRIPLLQRHFTSAQSRTRSQTNGYPTARRLQTRAGTTEAVRGYSMGPVFRTRTTLPEKGVANVAKKGRSNPFSL